MRENIQAIDHLNVSSVQKHLHQVVIARNIIDGTYNKKFMYVLKMDVKNRFTGMAYYQFIL